MSLVCLFVCFFKLWIGLKEKWRMFEGSLTSVGNIRKFLREMLERVQRRE